MSFSRPRSELIAVDDGYDVTKTVSHTKSGKRSISRVLAWVDLTRNQNW
jgi:hypothetical protein